MTNVGSSGRYIKKAENNFPTRSAAYIRTDARGTFIEIINGNDAWKSINWGKIKQSYRLRQNQGIFFMPYDIHTVTFLKPSSYLLLKKNKFNESAKDIFVGYRTLQRTGGGLHKTGSVPYH